MYWKKLRLDSDAIAAEQLGAHRCKFAQSLAESGLRHGAKTPRSDPGETAKNPV
jgi:hypothetical protein